MGQAGGVVTIQIARQVFRCDECARVIPMFGKFHQTRVRGQHDHRQHYNGNCAHYADQPELPADFNIDRRLQA